MQQKCLLKNCKQQILCKSKINNNLLKQFNVWNVQYCFYENEIIFSLDNCENQESEQNWSC